MKLCIALSAALLAGCATSHTTEWAHEHNTPSRFAADIRACNHDSTPEPQFINCMLALGYIQLPNRSR